MHPACRSPDALGGEAPRWRLYLAKAVPEGLDFQEHVGGWPTVGRESSALGGNRLRGFRLADEEPGRKHDTGAENRGWFGAG
jgi:hypothetical protein